MHVVNDAKLADNIHNHDFFIMCIDTMLSQVSTDNKSVVALLGAENVKLNCSIKLSNQIGPNFSAILVTWRRNSTTIEKNILLSPRVTENPAGYNDDFISTLMLSSVDYSNNGNYCCSASLAGNVSTMTDCLFLNVSGNHADHLVCALNMHACLSCFTIR